MATIQLKNVTKIFESEEGSLVAINDLSLDLADEQITSLVGPSGCGKTTVINLIAGFDRPTEGSIVLNGQGGGIQSEVGRSGVVFQADSVFPWMTVQQNVSYGLDSGRVAKHERAALASKYLRLVGLSEFAGRWPRELSGGMRKRVDLARAYAFDPEVLLLDEPFGSLDVLTKGEMQSLLLSIWHSNRKTILFVTHDPEEAIFVSHKVAVMTARPGTIKRVFDVPYGMPRDPAVKLLDWFVDLRREVVEALTN